MRQFLSCACLVSLCFTHALAESQPAGEGPLRAASFMSTRSNSLQPAQRFGGPAASTPCLDGVPVECTNVDDMLNKYGIGATPPDPTCAVGPTHVINATNVIIQWRPKNNPQGTPEFETTLAVFFGLTSDPTQFVYTTDPKVIYDQYAGRFVLVLLAGDIDSAVWLLAVSKTSDPNDGWWLHSFSGLATIGGGLYFADYPGLGVDDDAVYITANMFSQTSAVYGPFLWIVRKTPGGYDGPDGTIFTNSYDLRAMGLATRTTQPAHMFGPAPNTFFGAPFGTFLVSYGDLSSLGIESARVIAVNDPLSTVGGPFLLLTTLPCGDIDNNTTWSIPDAPQAGGGELIDTIHRHVFNAVWRDNSLYFAGNCVPPSGPEAGQVTAHWWRVSTTFDGVTSPTVALADQGNIGAEDLGAGTYTFCPSVMVDALGDMAVGFAASGPAIHPGAYFAVRSAGDPPGTIGPTCALAPGLDYYYRSVPPDARNRWGDYTGLALCPVDEMTFWIYNEYAGLGGRLDEPPTLGQGLWRTKLGKFHVEQPVSVAITSFDATASGGAVTLRGAFRSDFGVQAVNVYRGVEAAPLSRIESIASGASSFEYVDHTVNPGATYRYRIGVVDADGEFYSSTITVSVDAVRTVLSQNQPNPFNPTTEIPFTVAQAGPVSLDVYDIAGHLVRHLIAGEQTAGAHTALWDGRDERGNSAASGVYLCRLHAGTTTDTRRMVLLK